MSGTAMQDDPPVAAGERTRDFSDALLAIHASLELDAALQCIVEVARTFIGARYAAIGIVDGQGIIVDFITAGISDAERAAIGDLPRGNGLIGVLIHEQRTLRLRNLHDDPRAVGFPPHHPPMTSFLGVPIRLGEVAIGNLYLTEKEGAEEFTLDDQDIAERLAEHAAIALVNARAFTNAERQRRQLAAIIERFPDGVTICEAPSGRILMANRAARDLMGALPGSGGVEAWTNLQPERPNGEPYREDEIPMARALRSGDAVLDEEAIVRRDDRHRVHLAISAIPVRETARAVGLVVGLSRNMTADRETDAIKDDFLAVISHELRIPLTSIQGAASLLLTDGENLSPEAQRALRTDLVQESERLDRILKNMLALAAYQAGRLKIERELFLIQPVLQHAGQEAQARYPSHRFVIAVPPGLPPAEGDEELISQVVRNLVENAAKYSPRDATITLHAEKTDAMLTVSVQDDGPVIAPADQQRIFARFQRANTGVPGMGLGLYLCQRFVEAHGGRVWVDSETGKGATFRFTVPIAPEAGESP